MFKPKEEEKIQINDDEAVETEWDEVLKQATEEELVDLAGKNTDRNTIHLAGENTHIWQV